MLMNVQKTMNFTTVNDFFERLSFRVLKDRY